MAEDATNTLHCEVKCPKCGKTFVTDIGFRAGAINRKEYKIGQRLSWDGGRLRVLSNAQTAIYKR